MNECVDVARLRELRELVIRADSYLSLLWHRHVPAAQKDVDLWTNVERTISDLRRCYERGTLSESALTKALVPQEQQEQK